MLLAELQHSLKIHDVIAQMNLYTLFYPKLILFIRFQQGQKYRQIDFGHSATSSGHLTVAEKTVNTPST